MTVSFIKTHIRKHIQYFIIVFFALFPSWHSVSANETGKILLINSNISVKKYALAQSAFKPGSKVSTIVMDIGSPWINEDSVKAAIQQEHADVIYCIGSKAYMLARQSVGDTPVVFSSILKWQRLPLHEHDFGIAMELPVGMQLLTYRYLFPDIKKLGVLYSNAYSKVWIQHAVEAAKPLGMSIITQRLEQPSDLTAALTKLLPQVDALWLTPDPDVLSRRKAIQEIFQYSDSRKVPVFAYSDIFINFGAMLAISADIATMGEQASLLVKEILSGDIPKPKIQFPAGSQIILHMGKLERYGIHIRKGAMQSVNKVVR